MASGLLASASAAALFDSYNNVNLTLGAVLGSHPEAFLANRFGTMRPRTIGLRINHDL